VKTRAFDDILREVELTFDVHEGCGTRLGGVHFEMTGEDVTECVGGAAGVTVDDLDKNYASACDPRLNYRQTLEMGFRIAKRLGSHARVG
jgi:3-deoxy-7-phosphoheptulonate synthase